eukprot:11152886-Alexandrium_andersonii.AAC.1
MAGAPCRDKVSPEAAELLRADLACSGLREAQHEDGRVRMCEHHRQLYTTTRLSKKCAKVTCKELGTTVSGGMWLCEGHAREACGLGQSRPACPPPPAPWAPPGTPAAPASPGSLVARLMQRPRDWADLCERGGEACHALVRAPGGQYYAVQVHGLEVSTATAKFELPELGIEVRIPAELAMVDGPAS